ncbi:CGH_3_collapsed_G0015050.mRNA.1.CDS.1 [Saccharomyces cerevisiae]|nr:CGH_3_collapsed_G0015050.mRNA.1.CDS.1 [Saccharomyces cerevisiae]
MHSSSIKAVRGLTPIPLVFAACVTRLIVIARAYTGKNLVSLINGHPYLEVAHVSSRELKGQKKLEEQNAVDFWVMALTKKLCETISFVAPLRHMLKFVLFMVKSKMCSLSLATADHRFVSESDWAYGLPELNDRAKIANAAKIANPGCYATG